VAATYRLTPLRRLGNVVVRNLVRLGIGDRRTYLLAVSGRTSGRRYTTPVIVTELEGERFLVSPYGEREWVKNARAAGAVELSRGRRSEQLPVVEVTAPEAAPVLREYLRRVPITRTFFDVTPDSPLEAFAAEAPRHPVFRLGGADPA
jgi:deazaflavin-dependent oxidoreductase (nitroreductase family)